MARSPMPASLRARRGDGAYDSRRVSPGQLDDLTYAAADLLGAAEGLPDVAQLPNTSAARLLEPSAKRVRRALERIGAIETRGGR